MMEDPPVQPSRNLLAFISEVTSGTSKVSVDDVVFRNPNSFIAGERQQHYDTWDHILHDFHKKDEVLRYISEGVSVFDFFRPFKGQFFISLVSPRGKNYKQCIPKGRAWLPSMERQTRKDYFTFG